MGSVIGGGVAGVTAPDYARAALVIGYHTGMRRGEVCGLRWTQVNFLDGFIRLNAGETKNDAAREIPIQSELRLILEERYRLASRAGCPWVCFRSKFPSLYLPQDFWKNSAR